jgi:hypothetical protein
MAEITKPTDLNKIWASAGAILTPDDSKVALGWIVEAPAHQTENYLNNKHDRSLAYINQHGVMQWDAITEYHANKSWVQGSNGSLYSAKQTHTNQDPVSDTTETFWNLVLQGTGVVHKNDTTSFSRSWLANSNSSATGRSQLGSTSIGDALFTSSTAATARTSLGSTSIGDALFTAISSLQARNILEVFSASDDLAGLVERATDGEVIAGVDDTRYVTSKKLKLGFEVSLGSDGYIKLPSIYGGFTLQWKRVYVPSGGSFVSTFWPTTFPSDCLAAWVNYAEGNDSDVACWVWSKSASTVEVDHRSNSGKTLLVLGIGY